MTDTKKTIGSGRFSLNMDDVVKVAKNAVLVGIAAALTFAVGNLGEIEMGENLLILIPMITMGLQFVIKWAQDQSNVETVVDK